MTVTLESGAPLAVSLDVLKSYLRISRDDEDVLLESLIRAATDAAERFTGQVLAARGVTEDIAASVAWKRLSIGPVRSIGAVAALAADGGTSVLGPDGYVTDIDGNGDGWLRVMQTSGAKRVRVTYQAGMAGDAAGLPEGIRHGIVRLAGEYHASREGLEAKPPASVAALWRPWRRMRLS